jgi:GTP-binding protein
MGLGRAELSFTALDLEKIPEGRCPRWIALGRSNVGKSSLLNALVHPQKLFRTSSTPGKTIGVIGATLQLGRSEDSRLELIDVPGFGYARKRHDVQRSEWEPLMERLREKSHGRGLFWLWLVDPVRKPSEEEFMLRDWLGREAYAIVFTKCEGLKEAERKKIVKTWEAFLAGASEGPYWVSALKGQGFEELAKSARNFVRACAL